MANWQIGDADTNFGELLTITMRDGPQITMSNGIEMAALIPILEWRRRNATNRPSLKDLLLSEDGPRDLFVPPREP